MSAIQHCTYRWYLLFVLVSSWNEGLATAQGVQTCHGQSENGECSWTTCEDVNDQCEHFARMDGCTTNRSWMKVNCPKSCNLCGGSGKKEGKDATASEGQDMGVAQIMSSADWHTTREMVEPLLERARVYMETEAKDNHPDLLGECRNLEPTCAIWAANGECDSNPNYMKKTCAPVCQSCHFLTVEGRCPVDPNAPETWDVGDMDKMFRRLSAEPYLSQYDVQVLSSPEMGGPWVLTMENVVTPEEAQRLIELGAIEGYKRSRDVGALKLDGTFEEVESSGRTSSNAWCQNECYQDEVATRIMKRISNLTGINETNAEHLQLLKYEPGQFYTVHHDYIYHERNRQQGCRILTFYLYLSDVEEGGGTQFPKLDLEVSPKQGRALVWPSVLDHKPHVKDPRTDHQALKVIKGVKYGANAWFHIRDFKTPNANNCQ